MVWRAVCDKYADQLPVAPFGPAAFYLKSVAPKDVSLGEIFGSLLPFIAIQMFAVGLMVAFPGITAH